MLVSRNTFQKTVALLVACFCVKPAYAYLDPGTGSLLLQSLLAAIVAVLVAIKFYWFRLKHFVLSLFKSKSQPDPHSKPDSAPSKD